MWVFFVDSLVSNAAAVGGSRGLRINEDKTRFAALGLPGEPESLGFVDVHS